MPSWTHYSITPGVLFARNWLEKPSIKEELPGN